MWILWLHSAWCSHSCITELLGGSGGVVNSLDFCLASILKVPWLLLLPVHTFFTMEGGDSEFENFTLPTLKAFLEARSQKITCCLCNRMPPNAFFPWTRDLLISKKRRRHFFSHPPSPFPVIFATATVVAFVLLHNSRFDFNCYTQPEAKPTQKSARKWRCDL